MAIGMNVYQMVIL